MYSIYYRTANDGSPKLERADYEMLDWRYAEILALIASGHIVERVEYGGETLLDSAQIKAKLGIARSVNGAGAAKTA
jgi:hypothetical protein